MENGKAESTKKRSYWRSFFFYNLFDVSFAKRIGVLLKTQPRIIKLLQNGIMCCMFYICMFYICMFLL